MSLLCDIELDATLQFGSREMPLREVLELGPGDVVELDRHVSEPVDLVIGDRIVARGEVVIVKRQLRAADYRSSNAAAATGEHTMPFLDKRRRWPDSRRVALWDGDEYRRVDPEHRTGWSWIACVAGADAAAPLRQCWTARADGRCRGEAGGGQSLRSSGAAAAAACWRWFATALRREAGDGSDGGDLRIVIEFRLGC